MTKYLQMQSVGGPVGSDDLELVRVRGNQRYTFLATLMQRDLSSSVGLPELTASEFLITVPEEESQWRLQSIWLFLAVTALELVSNCPDLNLNLLGQNKNVE